MRNRTYESNSPRIVLALAAVALSCTTFAVLVLAPGIGVNQEAMRALASNVTAPVAAPAIPPTPTAAAKVRRNGHVTEERT
jgi:hypothetical protein